MKEIVIWLFNHSVSYFLPNNCCMGDDPKQSSLCHEVRCSDVEKYHNSYTVKQNIELMKVQQKMKYLQSCIQNIIVIEISIWHRSGVDRFKLILEST